MYASTNSQNEHPHNHNKKQPSPTIPHRQTQSNFYSNCFPFFFIVLPSQYALVNTILRALYKWNHPVSILFCLVSFAQHLFVRFTTTYSHSLFVYITVQYFMTIYPFTGYKILSSQFILFQLLKNGIQLISGFHHFC